jgi:hypothetical protein
MRDGAQQDFEQLTIIHANFVNDQHTRFRQIRHFLLPTQNVASVGHRADFQNAVDGDRLYRSACSEFSSLRGRRRQNIPVSPVLISASMINLVRVVLPVPAGPLMVTWCFSLDRLHHNVERVL